MRWQRWRRGLYAGLLATVTSCGSHGPPANVPERYAGALRSRDIDRGGQIFRTFCTPCHAGRVTPDGYGWSPAQMRQQIREGNRVMPAIRLEYLSNEDMEAVLAFLTVIGAVEAPLPAPPARVVPRPSPAAPVHHPTEDTAPADAGTLDDTAPDPEEPATEPDEVAPPALDDESGTPSQARRLGDPSER